MGDPMWMEKAFDPAHKGKLHRALGVPENKPIPPGKMAEAMESDDPHMRRMAQAATNAKRVRAKRVKRKVTTDTQDE